MFDPSEIIRSAWSTGYGPQEYGLHLANRPRKKLKGWQKANRKNNKKKVKK